MENEKLFELMEKMYSEMKQGFTKVDTRLDGMDSRLSNVEKTVTKIEVEQGKKLQALFDGYKQNTDILERLENKVDEIEQKVQTQEVEVRVLKNVK